jgi:hypothetical protein
VTPDEGSNRLARCELEHRDPDDYHHENRHRGSGGHEPARPSVRAILAVRAIRARSAVAAVRDVHAARGRLVRGRLVRGRLVRGRLVRGRLVRGRLPWPGGLGRLAGKAWLAGLGGSLLALLRDGIPHTYRLCRILTLVHHGARAAVGSRPPQPIAGAVACREMTGGGTPHTRMLHDHRGHHVEAILGAAEELLVHREARRAGEAGDGCPDDRSADAEVGRQHRSRYSGEDARDELDGTQLDSWAVAHHPPRSPVSVTPSIPTFTRPSERRPGQTGLRATDQPIYPGLRLEIAKRPTAWRGRRNTQADLRLTSCGCATLNLMFLWSEPG